jgi:hypothetical protein
MHPALLVCYLLHALPESGIPLRQLVPAMDTVSKSSIGWRSFSATKLAWHLAVPGREAPTVRTTQGNVKDDARGKTSRGALM